MTDPPDMAHLLACVRCVADSIPTPRAPVTDPATDVSDARRPTDGELEVLDLLRLPHPRAWVRLSHLDWAIVDDVADALEQARHDHPTTEGEPR